MLTANDLIDQYLETAVWADLEENDTKINTEFTKEAIKKATSEIQEFIDKVVSKFGIEKATELIECDRFAGDFFFTRQGHGVGFWAYPEVYGYEEADSLTEIAKTFREVYLGHVNTMRSKLTFD